MEQNLDNKYSDILVTIGIPVYNAGRFLGSTIKSVLTQTHSSFEVILTNDGSKDNSLEIMQSFNDPRIIIINDGKNLGLSARLNEQIQMAKGRYFARMDSDDLMFPNRIEKQLKFLEEHPEIDAIGTGAVIIDDENKVIGERLVPQKNTFLEALKANVFMHPTVMAKSDWYKKQNYTLGLEGVEDYDLWIRVIENSKMYNLQEPLLFYRDPLVLKTKTYTHRQKTMRKMFRNFLKSHPQYSSEIKKMIYMSGFKQIVLNFAAKLGMSDKIMQNRNTEAKPEYQVLLDEILKENK